MFMIYDLKAEGRVMSRRANPICRGSPQRHRAHRGGFGFLQEHDLDFILRVSVVNFRAKQSQFGRCRAGRPTHQEAIASKKAKLGQAGGFGEWCLGEADYAKQTQFPVDPIPHHSSIPSFQSNADCAKRTQFPSRTQNDMCSGVLGRKTQNTVLAYAVFWYSGVLGWRW